MGTIEEYVTAVERRLPRWLPGRRDMLADLRAHLSDRVAAGEGEPAAVRSLEPPAQYAAALLEGLELQPAPHGRRLGAFLVDVLLGLPLLAIAFLGFNLVMTAVSGAWPREMPLLWWQGMRDLLGAGPGIFWLLLIFAGMIMASAWLLSILYFPVAEAVWGTTIGKRLFGLCVASDDGTRVTWGRAFIRRLPFYFEFFWLDALFALFTRRHQRAFDHVARTAVVLVPGPS
jgi:uncharacterized RDD family membrane protein YckC